MKKQSAHSCIKDNRFIYGTRDDTGRSLMSHAVLARVHLYVNLESGHNHTNPGDGTA